MSDRLIKLLIVSAFSVLLLAGCEWINKPYKESDQKIDKTQQQIDKQKSANDASPAVIVKKDYYVDTKPVDVNRPAWLDKKVNFQGQGLAFPFIVSRVLRNTDAIVSYQSGIDAERVVSMDYTGNIQGALDNLAIMTDYAYTITGNQVNWSNFVTKNIDVSFMPGSADYSVGRESSSATSTRGDITTVTSLDDSQHSSLKGNVSVWKDLATTLNSLKSDDGTVTVSESTTSVMVHDHPSNVRAIEEYIKQVNKEMTRQVELKIKVMEIELDSNHQYGIDWTHVGGSISGTGIHLNGSASGSINTGGMSSSGAGNGYNSLTIGTENSNAVINALGLQGKLSMVTEPTVMTLNNQVAEVRITQDKSYLEQAEQSMATEGSTSTSITPGVVTSGFTLYVLPKIQDGQIYLNVSSTFSTLESLDTINNLGMINKQLSPSDLQTTDSSGNSDGLDIITIQVPTLAEKRFNVRSVVNNSNTLIVAGFKQLQDQNQDNQLFGSGALGGRGVNHTTVETIILITPTIIENIK